jgi:hypothetical protein
MPVTVTVGENSYITVTDADVYFNERLFPDAWLSATVDQKAQSLIMATKKIDRQYIRGIKADLEQTLEFPRSIYSNSRGINPFYNPLKTSIQTTPGWITETEASQEVKDATCEEAIAILQAGASAQKRIQLQQQGVKSFSLGNLSETFTGGVTGQKLLSIEATQLLQPYLSGGAVVV